jgi:ankyrin repeat protein
MKLNVAMFQCVLGFTSFHMAAQADNGEAVQLLVELICNKYKADKEAAEAAAEDVGGEETVSLEGSSVMSRNEDDSLSYLSSMLDPAVNAEVVAALSQPSRNKTTPLHVAVMNNSLKVLRLLLALKVNTNTQDSSGDTALHKAGRLQLNIAYQALLDAGASQTIKNNFGETPRDLLIDNPTY